jgi:hypothetical protein
VCERQIIAASRHERAFICHKTGKASTFGTLVVPMLKKASYRRLDPDKVIFTIDNLELRITTNIGERGLTRICRELGKVARDAKRRVIRLQRPNWLLRVLPIAMTALVTYLTWLMLMTRNIDELLSTIDKDAASEFANLIEALKQFKTKIAIPIALTVPLPLVIGMFVFIWTLESRWKRHRALRYLHELRSIIHVIDMHQLTKDPHHVDDGSDPDHVTGDKLLRYLDYCAELLSMSGKVAALYAESSHDPLVIETVNDLGQITSNLGNKIWQKLRTVEGKLTTDPA